VLALELAALGVDGAAVLQDVDEGQVVALADHEIVGVVGRRDLHGASTCRQAPARQH
jgi:hypothetical protein